MKQDYYYATRIARAISDLRECKDCLLSWLDKDNILLGVNGSNKQTIEQAPLLSAFVSYGRVFGQSYTENNSDHVYVSNEFKKLYQNSIGKFLKDELNIHERVINERNKSFAHSDGDSAGVSLLCYEGIFFSTMRNPYGGYNCEFVKVFKEIIDKLYNDFKIKQKEIVDKHPQLFK